MIDENTSEFDSAKMGREGFSIWNVKTGTYVVFDCADEDGDCISDTWSRFYKEFLPLMGYEAETDYEEGKKGLFCELWIPIRIK